MQNLQDSFALTAWQLVKEGRPFTETLTTTRFRMTTALKSLYVQIEMPPDTNQRSTSTTVLQLDGRLLGQPDPDRAGADAT